MDHPRKSSSSRISKSSSLAKRQRLSSPPPPPPPSSRPRPPPTYVNADLNNFRHVVQQLTGTPPPSASPSPSPARDTPPLSKPSRLQRIAPPPLRARQRNYQSYQQHQQAHRAAPAYHVSHRATQQDLDAVHYHLQPQQNATHQAVWRPPMSPHLDPNLSALSPHIVLTPSASAQASGETEWASLLHGTASPRFALSCASATFYPPLPPSSDIAEELARHGEIGLMDPFSPSGGLYSHSPLSGRVHTHTASSLSPYFDSSAGFSPSTSRRSLHSPASYGQLMLPNSPHGGPFGPSSPLNAQVHPSYGHAMPPLPSPATLSPISLHPPPYSPSTAFPWLPPWPPSPFLSPPPLSFLSHLPHSPSLFPLSPRLPPLPGSHAGFSFQPAKDP
ncbi:hypothetical protein L7F22_063692 [Adiantum nelumboides]|nr:hypothetical protein [Adiantum nelumboides]